MHIVYLHWVTGEHGAQVVGVQWQGIKDRCAHPGGLERVVVRAGAIKQDQRGHMVEWVGRHPGHAVTLVRHAPREGQQLRVPEGVG